MESYNKKDVIHPIELFNTVGEEFHDFLTVNNFSLDVLNKLDIDLQCLDKIEKFTKEQLKDIVKYTGNKEIVMYLESFQKDYRISKDKAEKEFKENKKIYRRLKHLQPMLNNEFNEGIDELEDIADFLDIEDESVIFEKVDANIGLYKLSNFEPDNLNLYAWLRRGEIDFHKLELPEYNEKLFKGWIDNISWKSKFQNTDYLFNIPSILKEFGVGVVFTPYLEKTVHGAVRWYDGKPLIQISDKGKCLASIWYTIFHEFGHVLLHRNDEVFEANFDLPQSKITNKEKEANTFANKYLFNGDGLRKHIFSFRRSTVYDGFIDAKSLEFDVPKMFIAYWMHKAQVRNFHTQDYKTRVSFTD